MDRREKGDHFSGQRSALGVGASFGVIFWGIIVSSGVSSNHWGFVILDIIARKLPRSCFSTPHGTNGIVSSSSRGNMLPVPALATKCQAIPCANSSETEQGTRWTGAMISLGKNRFVQTIQWLGGSDLELGVAIFCIQWGASRS